MNSPNPFFFLTVLALLSCCTPASWRRRHPLADSQKQEGVSGEFIPLTLLLPLVTRQADDKLDSASAAFTLTVTSCFPIPHQPPLAAPGRKLLHAPRVPLA